MPERARASNIESVLKPALRLEGRRYIGGMIVTALDASHAEQAHAMSRNHNQRAIVPFSLQGRPGKNAAKRSQALGWTRPARHSSRRRRSPPR